jgi:hypothetical protein
MLKNTNRLLLMLLSLAFLGCSSSNSKPLSIAFSADSNSIVISNIDKPGLLGLQQIKSQDSIFRELISILQTPSEKDTAIREELIPGKYAVSDTGIVFTPQQPFVKGREYLVITHMNAKFGDAEQIAKGQLSLGVKPVQKSLVR